MSEGHKQRYNTASRRSFLGAILAAGIAPAVVRATSVMKIIVPSKDIIIQSVSYGLGIGNDDFIIDGWIYKGRIDELRFTKGPSLRSLEDLKRNGPGPQWDGLYKPHFVKPQIAFDLSDTIPDTGKWTYVNIGPKGMSLER